MRNHKTFESTLPSIAMIGMGYAGTWLEIYLLDQATQDMTIYEIETVQRRIGGGIAYGECAEIHQVNLPPERMFGPHGRQQDYIEWINSADRSQWPESFRKALGTAQITAGSGTFPRGLFRHYSLDRLNEAKARAAARGLKINCVPVMAEAVAIDESGPRAVVHLSAMLNDCGKDAHVMNVDNGDGNCVVADVWIAATGHGPPMIAAFMKNVVQSERVVIDPWCPRVSAIMDARDSNESILYIGTGMTTYDLIMVDEQRGHKGRKVMISRHGDLHFTYKRGDVFKLKNAEVPEAFAKATTRQELLQGKPGEYAGALEIFARLTSPVAEGGLGMSSEDVLLAWQVHIPKLLANLSETDVIALFRHKTVINTRCIGIAPEVGAALDRAFAGGLEMWSGDVFDMEDRGDGIYVDCSHMVDGTPRRETIRFDRVYSGLGMSNDFNFIKERVPLWHSIIETNCFTQPHRFGGVKAEAGGKLPGARCGFVAGMPLSGTRSERGWMPTASGSVISIRTDLPAISERVMNQLAGAAR
jgi:uncharacterized NAD(P)/FAD-binding protein YdhS